ncbi:MAG: ATP-binding protein [Rhodocyclaceae bacterium]|nr:ATP-binding protein [Rhodocyclaceae bacterium]
MIEAVYHVRHPREVVPLACALACRCAQPELVAAGLAELITNGIEHGNLDIGFARKRDWLACGDFERQRDRRIAALGAREHSVCVSVANCAELVRFRVRDQGRGFDWEPWLRFDDSRAGAPNGRGIALARAACFASLYYIGSGNVVEAVALRDAARPRCAPGDPGHTAAARC